LFDNVYTAKRKLKFFIKTLLKTFLEHNYTTLTSNNLYRKTKTAKHNKTQQEQKKIQKTFAK